MCWPSAVLHRCYSPLQGILHDPEGCKIAIVADSRSAHFHSILQASCKLLKVSCTSNTLAFQHVLTISCAASLLSPAEVDPA
jgi:hypothetical protein